MCSSFAKQLLMTLPGADNHKLDAHWPFFFIVPQKLQSQITRSERTFNLVDVVPLAFY